MRKPYPSDMTDARWGILEPLIPVSTLGRPRDVDLREVCNAIFYLNGQVPPHPDQFCATTSRSVRCNLD